MVSRVNERCQQSSLGLREAAIFSLMVVLAGVAIARGIGWEPWDIASTYYIINYSDGLIRRGLFGSIVALIFDQAELPKHPHTMVTIHLVLLAKFHFLVLCVYILGQYKD